MSFEIWATGSKTSKKIPSGSAWLLLDYRFHLMSNYVIVIIDISNVLQCDSGVDAGDWLYEGVGDEDGDEDGDVAYTV